MTLSEFKLLTTNITAIVNQVFTIQCGEFATAMTQDQENTLSTETFDTDYHFETFDFQDILDAGYKDLDDLNDQFDTVWNLIDPVYIDELVNQIPSHLPKLTKKLGGNALIEWVKFSLDASEDAPIYKLHQYIMALFSGDEEDSVDLIREAIAYDSVDTLETNASKINAEHIKIDDLITAATIESFKVLGWLLKHAELNDKDTFLLLESNIDDLPIAEQILNLLGLNENQRNRLLEAAKSENNSALVKLLS